MISHRNNNNLDLRERTRCFAWLKAVKFRTLCFDVDETIFPSEQFIKSQNGRVYLTDRLYENLSDRLATKAMSSTSNCFGRCNRRWVLSIRLLRAWCQSKSDILSGKYSGGCFEVGRRSWTFQQNSAPSHKARVNQEWLETIIPNFISTTQWLPIHQS